jgi:hypothetical protein
MAQTGTSDPMKMPAEKFNKAAESYYRRELRQKYLDEAMTVLIDEWEGSGHHRQLEGQSLKTVLNDVLKNIAPAAFIKSCRKALLQDALTPEATQTMLCLTLLSVAIDGVPQQVH